MNCTVGDLARITGLPAPCASLNDRIVRCVEAEIVHGEPGWRLDRELHFRMTGACRCTKTGETFADGDECAVDSLQDKYLRPIRGLPGQDETLRWAPVPRQDESIGEPAREGAAA